MSKPEATLDSNFGMTRQQAELKLCSISSCQGKQGTVPQSGKSSGAKAIPGTDLPPVSDSSTDSDSSERLMGMEALKIKAAYPRSKHCLDNDLMEMTRSDAREEAEGNSTNRRLLPPGTDENRTGVKGLPLPFSASQASTPRSSRIHASYRTPSMTTTPDACAGKRQRLMLSRKTQANDVVQRGGPG